MNEFFYLMNIFINSILILLNIIFIKNAGSLFFKFHGKPVTTTLFYILLQASVVSIFASINASFAKYFLTVITTFNLIVTIILFNKKSDQKSVTYNFSKFIKASMLCILIIFFYSLISFKFKFIFNGHDPYLFGVPFEILKADYSGRLKVFDNYPFEWTKFHFFNGAITSVLLFPVCSLNIFIYKFSKLIFLILAVYSIIEYFNPSKKQIITTSILLVLFSSQFAWMHYTNGFVSLYLFIFLLLILQNKKESTNGEFLFLILSTILLFSTSTIRSLIPGFSMILFILISYYKELKLLKNQNIIVLLILTTSITTMVLTGETNLKNATISLNYKNYFSIGWNDLFFIRSSINNLKVFIISIPQYGNFIFFIWFISVVIFVINNFKFLYSIINYKNAIVKFSIILYLLINFISLVYYNNKYLFVLSSVSLLITPILIIFTTNDFNKLTKCFLIVFVVSSLLQIAFISPSSSIPNALLCDYILLYMLVDKINKIQINVKSLIFLPIILIPFFSFHNLIIPQKNDRTTRVIELKKYFEKKIINTKNTCDLNQMQNDFIVNTSIFGMRQNYNILIGDSISVSQNFILKKH